MVRVESPVCSNEGSWEGHCRLQQFCDERDAQAWHRQPHARLAGWISTRWARSVCRLIVSILLCSGLAAPGLADDPLRARDVKTQEMVAASVRIETGLGAIY